MHSDATDSKPDHRTADRSPPHRPKPNSALGREVGGRGDGAGEADIMSVVSRRSEVSKFFFAKPAASHDVSHHRAEPLSVKHGKPTGNLPVGAGLWCFIHLFHFEFESSTIVLLLNPVTSVDQRNIKAYVGGGGSRFSLSYPACHSHYLYLA